MWRNISTGGNAFWLVNGPVQTATPPFLANGDLGWEIRGFGDLNGDTSPDVIWQHATLGRLAVWFFTGTTLLSTEYIDCNPDPNITDCVEPDLNWKIMAAADMDQDGRTDLVWQHLRTATCGLAHDRAAEAGLAGCHIEWQPAHRRRQLAVAPGGDRRLERRPVAGVRVAQLRAERWRTGGVVHDGPRDQRDRLVVSAGESESRLETGRRRGYRAERGA